MKTYKFASGVVMVGLVMETVHLPVQHGMVFVADQPHVPHQELPWEYLAQDANQPAIDYTFAIHMFTGRVSVPEDLRAAPFQHVIQSRA